MIIHSFIQGSPEWHAHRAAHYNASDAPAMMGVSPYKKRSDLIREYATGAVGEIDPHTQTLFNDGHRFEALTMPLAEEIIGEDLYPITGTLGELGASFDGLTMAHDIAWENKTLNNDIRAAQTAADLGLHLRIQMEQQLFVSGATKALFTATKWDESGNLIEKVEFWYVPDYVLRDQIIAGWGQFKLDVTAYQHVEVLPAITADVVLALPSLSIRVMGEMSLQSNLPEFGVRLKAFIGDIVTEPKTDQDFANAENAIKILKEAEEALDRAESAALAQTVSIDEMRKLKEMYWNLSRDTRLMMEKVVKIRKETIRVEMLNKARTDADAYIADLNARIGKPYMPAIAHDFPGVMKSQKTVTSLQNKVDTELSQFKSRADAVFKTIMFNITTLRELAPEHHFLFADSAQIVLKANDDCTSLIKVRIAEHKESEAKRLEAERAKIAEEERVKAEANNAALIKAEAEKLAAEQAKKDKVLQDEADSLAREQATRAAAQKAAESAPVSLDQVLSAAAPAEIAKALAPAGEVHKFPKVVETPAARPTDAEILLVLAIHFNITSPQAMELVRGMDIFNSRPAIALQPVKSGQIHAIGHDPVENLLSVQFKGKGDAPGSVYTYKNVDVQLFEELKNAESIGTFFGKHIKNSAERFPFLKVG